MERIISIIESIRILDILDILIVAIVFYKLYMLIRETRAEQLVKGILLLFVFAKITEWLKLYTINWILSNAISVGVFAIVIVFQPELRRMLEYIGRSKILKRSILDPEDAGLDRNTAELVHAMTSLSRQRIGALILLERTTGLNEIVATGTQLNALISSELLINIFIPNTPLHDGAVVIKGDIIRAAGCFLPLTENQTISKELGTRHRAAIGISERSDTLAFVVSEETGAISVAEKGALKRDLDEESLRLILQEFYEKSESSIFAFWRQPDEEE